MKQGVKFSISLFLLLFFITSCGSKFSLQKRRYNKGFHFSVINNHSVKTSENILKRDIEIKNTLAESINEEKAVTINNSEAKKETTNHSENKTAKYSVPKATEEIFANVKLDEFEKEESVSQNKGATKSTRQIKSRGIGLFDILADIYVGSFVIRLVLILIFLIFFLGYTFSTYTLAQILPVAAIVILCLLFFYWIGSLVRGR